MFLVSDSCSVLPVPLYQNSQTIGVTLHWAVHFARFCIKQDNSLFLCLSNGKRSDIFELNEMGQSSQVSRDTNSAMIPLELQSPLYCCIRCAYDWLL